MSLGGIKWHKRKSYLRSITSCKQNRIPPPKTAASSPTCAEMRWARWRWSLPPGASIFGGAQTEEWPWCHWVPSATTERSQAAILAIYISCQLGSCFFSCSWCARQAWSLLMMERKENITAQLISEGQWIIKYVQEAYNMLFTLSRAPGFKRFCGNSNFAES